MRIDVSEVKTFDSCKRKWFLTSRNRMHLRNRTPNEKLLFGTLFHEGIHGLYQGRESSAIIQEYSDELADDTQRKVYKAIMEGYERLVLPGDLEKYKVLEIEHGFSFRTDELPDVDICGSIDMLVLEEATREIHGFEHKSAARFRPDLYTAFDEQPRVYYQELLLFVDQLNKKLVEGEQPYKAGYIFLNEVKKVQRTFEYKRTPCKYTESDLQRFFEKFLNSCSMIQKCSSMSLDDKNAEEPQPNFMGCQMCDFQLICGFFGYNKIDPEKLLEEFGEEVEVRDTDHLDEKAQRFGGDEE